MMLEKYLDILEMTKGFDSLAHVGGGAVRDTLLERPIKDIDLFLHDACTDDAAKLMRSIFGYVKTGEWESYDKFSDPHVARVCKFEKHDEELPVCLIGLKSPRGMQDNLARFDFGCCMAGWDGNAGYTADEYDRDIKNKTFTLCRADNQAQFDYSMIRFQTMTADRYAGWKLVVPKEFEKRALHYTFRKHWYRDDASLHLYFKFDEGQQQLKAKAR